MTRAATPLFLYFFVRMSMPTNDRWRVDIHVDELLIRLQHEEREYQVEPPAVLEQPEALGQEHRIEDQR